MTTETLLNLFISLAIGMLFLILSIYFRPKKKLWLITRCKDRNPDIQKTSKGFSSEGIQNYRALIANTGKLEVTSNDIPVGINISPTGTFDVLGANVTDSTPHVVVHIELQRQYLLVNFNYLNPNDYIIIDYTIDGKTTDAVYSSPLIGGKIEVLHSNNSSDGNIFIKSYSYFIFIVVPVMNLIGGIITTLSLTVGMIIYPESIKNIIQSPNIYNSEFVNWFLLFALSFGPLLFGVLSYPLWYGHLRKVAFMKKLPDRAKYLFDDFPTNQV